MRRREASATRSARAHRRATGTRSTRQAASAAAPARSHASFQVVHRRRPTGRSIVAASRITEGSQPLHTGTSAVQRVVHGLAAAAGAHSRGATRHRRPWRVDGCPDQADTCPPNFLPAIRERKGGSVRIARQGEWRTRVQTGARRQAIGLSSSDSAPGAVTRPDLHAPHCTIMLLLGSRRALPAPAHACHGVWSTGTDSARAEGWHCPLP